MRALITSSPAYYDSLIVELTNGGYDSGSGVIIIVAEYFDIIAIALRPDERLLSQPTLAAGWERAILRFRILPKPMDFLRKELEP